MNDVAEAIRNEINFTRPRQVESSYYELGAIFFIALLIEKLLHLGEYGGILLFAVPLVCVHYAFFYGSKFARTFLGAMVAAIGLMVLESTISSLSKMNPLPDLTLVSCLGILELLLIGRFTYHLFCSSTLRWCLYSRKLKRQAKPKDSLRLEKRLTFVMQVILRVFVLGFILYRARNDIPAAIVALIIILPIWFYLNKKRKI